MILRFSQKMQNQEFSVKNARLCNFSGLAAGKLKLTSKQRKGWEVLQT